MDAYYAEYYAANPVVEPRFPGEVAPTLEATMAMTEEEKASLVPTFVQVHVEKIQVNEDRNKINEAIHWKKEEGRDMLEDGYDEDDVEKFLSEELEPLKWAKAQLDQMDACLHTKVKDLIRQMAWLGIEQPDMCPGDEFLDGIEDDEDWFGNFL
jgi:hypothetical protein